MLPPYQLASNRPIDGVDLDGLEYSRTVSYDEETGTTHIKINLSVKKMWDDNSGSGIDNMFFSSTVRSVIEAATQVYYSVALNVYDPVNKIQYSGTLTNNSNATIILSMQTPSPSTEGNGGIIGMSYTGTTVMTYFYFIFFAVFLYSCGALNESEKASTERSCLSTLDENTFASIALKEYEFIDTLLDVWNSSDNINIIFEGYINDSLLICAQGEILFDKKLKYNKSVGRVPFDIIIDRKKIPDDGINFYMLESKVEFRLKEKVNHKYYYVYKHENKFVVGYSMYRKIYR